MVETERTRHARTLFSGIAGSYDSMAEALSFGQNARWRRFLASRVPADVDSRVLDVATGTAGVAIELARLTGARVVGIDQSPEMVRWGREAIRRAGLDDRIRLVLGQAERLPFPDGSFDHLTFTYLLRYVDDPAATLRELARVVRPGGIVACLEFSVPLNPLWRAAWFAYTRTALPLAGLLASREWYRTGRFLGPSIEGFWRSHPLDQVLGWWDAAGIGQLRAQRLSVGGAVIIRGIKT